MVAIKFQRDRLGGVDWAHLPDSIFSLARFVSDGHTYLVPDAFNGKKNQGRWIRVTHPDFEYAGSFAAFKRLATAFQNESTS